jgi:hypothetical protein
MGGQVSQPSREKRLSRIVRGALVTPDGREHELLIRNVSDHGFGAKTADVVVRAGDQVVVQLPNIGRITGTVRWAKVGAFGVHTAEAIDTDLLLFRGEERAIAPRPDEFRVPRSFEPNVDPRRPGFGRWRRDKE